MRVRRRDRGRGGGGGGAVIIFRDIPPENVEASDIAKQALDEYNEANQAFMEGELFSWNYKGLDIDVVNNRTVPVITRTGQKLLDLVGDVSYNANNNEYVFYKNANNYLSISGEIFNGSGEASISFFYKTNSANSSDVILSIKNDNYTDPQNPDITIRQYQTQDKILIKNNNNTFPSNTINYNASQYVHMVFVFTENNIYVYQNDVLVETYNHTNIIDSGERVHQLIGAGVSDAGIIYRPFDGFIKNLRFYNYALTSAEVSSIYSMYSDGMNDTVPQITSVTLTSTDVSHDASYNESTINIEMDISYSEDLTTSSIFSQQIILNDSHFDVSFGRVHGFRSVPGSDTKVQFKFSATTTIHNSKIFLKENTIIRHVNSLINVVSNPSSPSFVWKYNSLPLEINFSSSCIGQHISKKPHQIFKVWG